MNQHQLPEKECLKCERGEDHWHKSLKSPVEKDEEYVLDPRRYAGQTNECICMDGGGQNGCNGVHKQKVTPRTLTIPKPQWWENRYINKQHRDFYREALEACEKASNIQFTLED